MSQILPATNTPVQTPSAEKFYDEHLSNLDEHIEASIDNKATSLKQNEGGNGIEENKKTNLC